MAERENMALVERYFGEVRNQRNSAAAQQIFAPDVAVHVDTASGAEVVRGVSAIRETVGEYLSGVPDLRFEIQDMVTGGDKIAVRWRAEGTHSGSLHGLPGTGKQVSFGGIDIFRVAGGKIAEGWSSYDRLSIMQQIGAAAGHQAAGR